MGYYSNKQVTAAVEHVLGKDVVDALAGTRPLPNLIGDACILAFVYGKGDADDHYFLRQSMADLFQHGELRPDRS